MHNRLYLPVIRDHLQTHLADFADSFVVHEDQLVEASNGRRRIITLSPGSVGPGPSAGQEGGMEMLCGFTLGITYRAHECPPDRIWEKLYAEELKGIERAIMSVFAVMRRDAWKILCQINTAFAAKTVDWLLVEPFRYTGDTAKVTEVGAAHFNADDERAGKKLDLRNAYGLYVALEYGEGRFMARHYDEAFTHLY